MFNFESMIKHIELGGTSKRDGWGYSKTSELILLDNRGVKNIFITNTMRIDKDDIVAYELTYSDIKALDWILI